jgi:hypothetical protein
MAHLIEGTYAKYHLDEEEFKQGSVLTITQRQVIQNALASTAEEFLSLEYDINNPHSYIQVASYQQGMMAAYQYILDLGTSAQQLVEEQAQHDNEVARDNYLVDSNLV